MNEYKKMFGKDFDGSGKSAETKVHPDNFLAFKAAGWQFGELEKPAKPEKVIDDAAEDGSGEGDSAEDLAANNKRADLEQLAKDVGLDGNKYTNKLELAEAILAAQSK